MAINNDDRISGPYTSGTVFPFDFKIFDPSELVAVQTNSSGVNTTLTLTTNYTVSLNPDQDVSPGGSITLVAGALPADNLITLTSAVEYTQLAVFANLGGFYPAVLNNILDKLTILIQQNLSIANRSVRFPISDGLNATDLPSRSNRALRALVFDANGQVAVSDIPFADVAALAQQAIDASVIAVAAANTATQQAQATIAIPSNALIMPTGANVARSLANLLRDSGLVVHSRDFSQIDHTGAVNSCSGLFKMFLKSAANPTQHITYYIDADDGNGIKLGNDAQALGTVLGSMTALNITYQSTNVVRFTFSGARWVSGITYAPNAVVSNITNPQWITATVYGAGDAVTNNGIKYTTVAGGTSGATPPTHTTGSVSDGGVTWVYAGAGARVYRTIAGGISGVTAPTHTSGSASDGGVLWANVGLEPLMSGFSPSTVAANRAFLTVGLTANLEPNQGIHQISSIDDSTGAKTVDVTLTRTDSSSDEVGHTISSLKIAGPEPVYYPGNCTIINRARLRDFINTGFNFCICSANPDDDNGTFYSNTHARFEGGGMIEFPTRAFTQSEKGWGWTCIDIFSMQGYRTTGNTSGSFTLQGRNSTRGWFSGGNLLAGDTVGEDGLHFTRNCWDIRIDNLSVESGDDAISFTQENGGGVYTIRDIVVCGCTLRSKQNSSIKILIDSSSAALGSRIFGLHITDCILGLHDATTAGNNIRVISLPGFESLVSDIKIDDCKMNATSGTLVSTSIQVDYCTRVNISRNHITGMLRNTIIFNGGFDNRFEDNDIYAPTPQTSTTDLALTLNTITYVSGSTYQFAFDPSSNLSTAGTTFTFLNIPSGTANFNGKTLIVSAVDNTAKTVNCTVGGRTSLNGAAFNEATLTAPTVLRKQAGEYVVIAGGDGHFIKNNRPIMSYTDAGGKLVCGKDFVLLKTDTNGANVLNPTPTNMQCEWNTVEKQVSEDGFNIQQCNSSSFSYNKSKNSTGRYFIQEGTNAANANNRFVDNTDDGTLQYDISFQFSKVTSLAKGNRGNVSDRIRGTISIPTGNTASTIVVADGIQTPTGVTVTTAANALTNLVANLGFSRGFGATFLEPRLLRLTPTSWGNAKNFKIGYNNVNRTFTVTTDVDPGATGFAADFELDTMPQW